MKLKLTLFLLIAGMAFNSMAQQKADAILGEWLSPKKDTRFQIYRQENQYFGKILWGSGSQTKDVKNPDPALRNRELIGLVMLTNFTFDGSSTWEDGKIYDPREGKTYSCKINMKNNNQIEVRGYLGISLFGRTEIWTRIK